MVYAIHHVALSVSDLESSVEFYSKLGFQQVHFWEAEDKSLPIIGTKHFGLKVHSIEEARADLAAKGVVEQNTQITQGRTGPRYFFIEDPDRILVEIAEDKREFTI